MKEKMTFIACDGKEFDCMDDAIEYETDLMIEECKNSDRFVARDRKGNIIDLNDRSLDYLLEYACFIDIKTSEASTAMDNLNESGFYEKILPSEIGHFRWDEDKYEWRELLDDLEELNELWAPIGKKFEIRRKN